MEKKKIVLVLAAFFLVACSSLAYAELTPPLPGGSSYIDKDVEEVHEMLDENSEQLILLDVRTKAEYSDDYIPGAINIPLSDLENRIDELDRSKAIIVYCKSGGRSKTASGTLAQHDFIVYNMLEGINAWKVKFATSTSTPAPTGQAPSPTVAPSHVASPALTPAASAPASSAPASPAASPVTTPGEGTGVPGFEVTSVIAAISMIAWCLLRKRRK